jgi:hypothetical protein
MTVYEQNGYKNRFEYLEDQAECYGVDKGTVLALAAVLGESEDFDGLISTLQDME